jgi:hypothetical protein
LTGSSVARDSTISSDSPLPAPLEDARWSSTDRRHHRALRWIARRDNSGCTLRWRNLVSTPSARAWQRTDRPWSAVPAILSGITVRRSALAPVLLPPSRVQHEPQRTSAVERLPLPPPTRPPPSVSRSRGGESRCPVSHRDTLPPEQSPNVPPPSAAVSREGHDAWIHRLRRLTRRRFDPPAVPAICGGNRRHTQTRS